MNLHDLIAEPIYDLIDFYSGICAQHGENASYFGVTLLDEPEKFVKGHLFNDCARLCIYDRKTNNGRLDESVRRLHRAVDFMRGDKQKTWGKSMVLHGLCALKRADLLSVLTEEEITLLEEISRYDDFFDKESMTLKGYATNYYQVAMACAGMREMLGFENDGMCEKIKEKLFTVMQDFSDTGWMDENPPFGRFDRYSLMVCAELSDTLRFIGREVPEFAKENLRKAYRLAMACANEKGDGVVYGRSLSVHGDCAFLEIISSALSLGLVPEDEKAAALAYSVDIVKKTMSYWYDRDRKSFNIWFDGRTTNKYRQVRRLMEVNLDMCNHMLSTLENFEAAGLDTYESDGMIPKNPHDFGNPYRVDFVNEPGKKRSLFCFVRQGNLIQLPLIGPGNMRQAAAYLPFPALAKQLEAAPESQIPWLVPEYTTDDPDVKYVPYQFYTSIREENKENETTVYAEGYLAEFRNDSAAQQSEYRFQTTYTFAQAGITVRFHTDLPSFRSKIVYPKPDGAKAFVSCTGCETLSNIDNDALYFTPHGRCTLLKAWHDENRDVTLRITNL